MRNIDKLQACTFLITSATKQLQIASGGGNCKIDDTIKNMCINKLTRLVCLPIVTAVTMPGTHRSARAKTKSFVDTTQKVAEIAAAESPQFTAALHSVWVWPHGGLSASLCSGRLANLRCLRRKLYCYYH